MTDVRGCDLGNYSSKGGGAFGAFPRRLWGTLGLGMRLLRLRGAVGDISVVHEKEGASRVFLRLRCPREHYISISQHSPVLRCSDLAWGMSGGGWLSHQAEAALCRLAPAC